MYGDYCYIKFSPCDFSSAAFSVGLYQYFHWFSLPGASSLSSSKKIHVGKYSISGPLRKPTTFTYHNSQILNTNYVSGTELVTYYIGQAQNYAL